MQLTQDSYKYEIPAFEYSMIINKVQYSLLLGREGIFSCPVLNPAPSLDFINKNIIANNLFQYHKYFKKTRANPIPFHSSSSLRLSPSKTPPIPFLIPAPQNTPFFHNLLHQVLEPFIIDNRDHGYPWSEFPGKSTTYFRTG